MQTFFFFNFTRNRGDFTCFYFPAGLLQQSLCQSQSKKPWTDYRRCKTLLPDWRNMITFFYLFLAILHWLPVHFNIDFKTSLITFKALSSLLADLLIPYSQHTLDDPQAKVFCVSRMDTVLKAKRWGQNIFQSGPWGCGMNCSWKSGQLILCSP